MRFMVRKALIFLPAILAVGFIAALVACGGDDNAVGQTTGATSSAAAGSAAASDAATQSPSTSPAQASPSGAAEAPAAGTCTATASVNDQSPPKKFTEIVTGVLSCSGSSPKGAAMHAIWHEKTSTKTCDGTADANGTATCRRKINLTSGYTVVIDVTFTLAGKTYSAATSFTPQ